MNTRHLKDQLTELQSLLKELQPKENYADKLKILNTFPKVQKYVLESGPVQHFLQTLTPESQFAIQSIVAIGQAPLVFNIQHLSRKELFKKLITLLEQLLELESFYFDYGGIIGYQVTMLDLMVNHLTPPALPLDKIRYIHPEGLHLAEDTAEVRQVVRWGIENMQHLGMIYPVGGAGDRLNLKDEITGSPLPAALLSFLGRTLLEDMLRDLQAREYLSFKLFGRQPLTPIAMMTSAEKNNHMHILNICKNANWFGRPAQSFFFFMQPLVPVITVDGNWSLSAPMTLNFKPCGHGVLWKLAEENGVFKWFESQNRRQCLVRQINNPLAGTDYGLFGLIGVGCHEHKAFGFLSCERLLNSEEGTNVLIETQTDKGYDYCLTNIEYTEFTLKGIGDTPAQPSSAFSIYPANTNILFVDIPSVQKILKKCPIPGQLVNLKSKVPYLDQEGTLSYVQGGRLESTMQNIADYIIDHFPAQIDTKAQNRALHSFILYHPRSKTISTTKKAYTCGESPIATPEQAFYDLLSNNYLLLKQCGFDLPIWRTVDEYLKEGPNCIFLFHPALGPLYSIITQKIHKGHFYNGAELQLEIAEVEIEDLSMEGSLLIEALSPLGTRNTSGHVEFGKESRCTLKRVKIHNRGINWTLKQQYWKNAFMREEQVKIILHEGSEFHAEDLTLEGKHYFEVPAHHRLILSAESNGRLKQELLPIQKATWHWKYAFDSQNAIQLNKVE